MKTTEVIAITLSNGDVALFVNGDAVLTLDASDSGENPAEIGKYLTKALGVELQKIEMEVPTDEDWSWNDVYELLPPAQKTEARMLVSLDGGATFQPAPEGVRIAYQKVMVGGEDGRGELVINATHEGWITDLWVHRNEPEVSLADYNHNIGTDCIMIEDIVSRLVKDGE